MVKAIALFALLAPLGANAHYIFNRLIVNGQSIGGEYAYVRKNSNSYNPSIPSELMNSNDLRCNKGATAGNTATYTVKAGDKLGFKIFNNELVEHPGPGFVYISKAPSSVKSYDGSGDWVKVMQSGLKNPSTPGVDTAWDSWQKDRLEWTIQNNIPSAFTRATSARLSSTSSATSLRSSLAVPASPAPLSSSPVLTRLLTRESRSTRYVNGI
jgi:hypothetical protein